MQVLSSMQDGNVATMTVSLGDDDHKFEVWAEDGTAYVEYQESLTWRGQVRVLDPDESVYKSLMVSDEMTRFLETQDCDSVKRAGPQH